MNQLPPKYCPKTSKIYAKVPNSDTSGHTDEDCEQHW